MRCFADLLNQNLFSRCLKNIRNDIVDKSFRRKPPTGKYVTIDVNSTPILIFIVAYNIPTCIEVLLRRKAFFNDAHLVVVDNSSSSAARDSIFELCRNFHVTYFGLPINPEWNPNRSHGLALNWVFYNLVQQWRPNIFGFLDHDCYPCKSFELNRLIDGYNFYGLKHHSPLKPRLWNLWAGFCFYRLKRLHGLELDFKHVVEDQLDTGGKNWYQIYQHTTLSECRFAKVWGHNEFDIFYHLGRASKRYSSISVSEIEEMIRSNSSGVA
jgi:hypothetical protein